MQSINFGLIMANFSRFIFNDLKTSSIPGEKLEKEGLSSEPFTNKVSRNGFKWLEI